MGAASVAGGSSASASSAAPVPLTKLKKKISFRLPIASTENPDLLISSIEIFDENESPHALVFYKNGSCSVLSLADILKLFAFNEVCLTHDFTFDFASFSYSKLVYSYFPRRPYLSMFILSQLKNDNFVFRKTRSKVL